MHALLSTLGSGCDLTSCFKILLCLPHNDGLYPGTVSLKLKQVTATRKSKLKTFLQKLWLGCFITEREMELGHP